ncbi:MAG TPA: hypothetical protein VIE36_23705 [Methylomirabilota bacterium]
MRGLLPALVGVVAALVAAAVVLGVETHLFPGADALFGVLGALALGYVAKALAALGLTRPAPPAENDRD